MELTRAALFFFFFPPPPTSRKPACSSAASSWKRRVVRNSRGLRMLFFFFFPLSAVNSRARDLYLSPRNLTEDVSRVHLRALLSLFLGGEGHRDVVVCAGRRRGNTASLFFFFFFPGAARASNDILDAPLRERSGVCAPADKILSPFFPLPRTGSGIMRSFPASGVRRELGRRSVFSSPL